MTVRSLILRFVLGPIALSAVAFPLQKPEEKVSIAGIVINDVSGEPIEDVRIIPGRYPDDYGQPSIPAVLTDASGRFAVRDLSDGAYTLGFERNGYVRQLHGERVFSGNGIPLTVSRDKALVISMRMIPTGAVSGRIRDRSDRPASGVHVWLARPGYESDGRKTLWALGETSTNDRGEYRIYFVTPGRYYVCSGGANHSAESYSPICYPDAPSANSAALVDIQPGSEVSGLNWTVSEAVYRRVRGLVIDGRTGQPAAEARIRLRYRDLANQNRQFRDVEIEAGSSGRDGLFEIPRVAEGLYYLIASLADAVDDAERRGVRRPGSQPGRSGYVFLDVQSDLDELKIVIPPPLSISGRWSSDAPADLGAVASRLGLLLQPLPQPGLSLNAPAPPLREQRFSGDTVMSPNGAVRLNNVAPGDYRIFLLPPNAGVFLKDARMGGIDVFNEPLHFRPGDEAKPLEITIGQTDSPGGDPTVGGVEGVVVNEKGDPIPMAVVALVPERPLEQGGRYRSITASLDGRFDLKDISPGAYNVLAWEALEPHAYFDSELIAAARSQGIPVRISPGSRQTLTVRAIPLRR